MFDIICVTKRKLCTDFFATIERLAKSDVQFIILREKDLNEDKYFDLATKVYKICKSYNKTLVIHNYINVAIELGIKYIHLPYSEFCKTKRLHNYFKVVGTSVHSTDDAIYAERQGADYITAGHIFATDCKKGLEPKGIDFLKNICGRVNIPVYAIGGINENSVKKLKSINFKNFAGACVMSGLMKSNNPEKLIELIKDSYK